MDPQEYPVIPPVYKNTWITGERIDKFLSTIYWTDCNIHSVLTDGRVPLHSIQVAGPTDRFVLGNTSTLDYRNASVGDSFGPSWSTYWFRIKCKVPAEWGGRKVYLRWNSGCEGLVWKNGSPQQGLTGGDGHDLRDEYIVCSSAEGGETIELEVELAANGMFGLGNGSQISPPDPNRHFTLSVAELIVKNEDAHALYRDMNILHDMTKHLGESGRKDAALMAANRVINAFDGSAESIQECLRISKAFLGIPNGIGQYKVSAVGHCHIDTAWLWPYDETKRKCARSWATQLRLMEEYPFHRFACSQAQQFEWVKTLYPELYGEIKASVGKGSFVPTGGTWVEMDCNLPSGESLVRQFLFGQTFFKEEFGEYCTEFWLPDTFGYSAQLPQIVRGSGMECFLTQKLSWNLFNKFPHHTFLWEGLDGSRLLTHFPPADTYNSMANVEEICKSANSHRDRVTFGRSMMLFGHGDGGGGPTPEMMENIKRLTDCDGVPVVEMDTPASFFSKCREVASELPVWSGELYLELHRGTYTSEARTKKGNRMCENLMQRLEFLYSLRCCLLGTSSYPDLSPMWKDILLNQFHDVIPGSSIGMVYEEVENMYASILRQGEDLESTALQFLAGEGGAVGHTELFVANSLSFERSEVVEVERSVYPKGQATEDGSKSLVRVSAPPLSAATLEPSPIDEGCQATVACMGPEGLVMTNGTVTARISPSGLLAELRVNGLQRNLMASSGNIFKLFDDVPLYWDAWDVEVFHLEKFSGVKATSVRICEEGPVRAGVEIRFQISEKSHIVQKVYLEAGSPLLKFDTTVEWHESHKFLKVEFPVAIRSDKATFEIQYGHIQRPTHFNTSWDVARFEGCAQRWADLSEFGSGVALLNDCKYGNSVHGNVMRLSLLRSPKKPNENADMGVQRFCYALYPHAGNVFESRVIQAAHAFNNPLSLLAKPLGSNVHKSMFTIDSPNVLIDTIKRSEDKAALIVRMYEAYGGHATATLASPMSCFKSVQETNLIESEVYGDESTLPLKVELAPFQIKTFRVRL